MFGLHELVGPAKVSPCIDGELVRTRGAFPLVHAEREAAGDEQAGGPGDDGEGYF